MSPDGTAPVTFGRPRTPADAPRNAVGVRRLLGDGDEVNSKARRAALRVFEHAFGRSPEEPEETPLPDEVDLTQLSMSELVALRRRLEQSGRQSRRRRRS